MEAFLLCIILLPTKPNVLLLQHMICGHLSNESIFSFPMHVNRKKKKNNKIVFLFRIFQRFFGNFIFKILFADYAYMHTSTRAIAFIFLVSVFFVSQFVFLFEYFCERLRQLLLLNLVAIRSLRTYMSRLQFGNLCVCCKQQQQ